MGRLIATLFLGPCLTPTTTALAARGHWTRCYVVCVRAARIRRVGLHVSVKRLGGRKLVVRESERERDVAALGSLCDRLIGDLLAHLSAID